MIECGSSIILMHATSLAGSAFSCYNGVVGFAVRTMVFNSLMLRTNRQTRLLSETHGIYQTCYGSKKRNEQHHKLHLASFSQPSPIEQ
ncbi:hypothetical protein P691DRAFT_412219 [Macrolepiota fuliginosa MF-IS2]|uniref:Uncharacterized protein n=1 Tax=Macrolepiota fuliginosa MF-IS2 TaxID=1400762 RepID=A0A9P5XI00_9AGAR|nr:hypothetical protein P691DRAFT_412219 [Macrolepiota fuliginosa MF-IS2]